MKKFLVFIIAASLVLSAVGCGKDNTKTTADPNVTNTKQEVQNNNKIEENNQNTTTDAKASSDIISDITNWQHPTKSIFEVNNIKILKVIMTNNDSYPIFYVTLPYNLDSNHKEFYTNIINSIANGNGYNSYKIIDESKKVELTVYCDKDSKVVKSINYNLDNEYFNDNVNSGKLLTEADMVKYIKENVKEITSLQDSLKKSSNGKVGVAIYVEREPDSQATNRYLKDYYGVYVGEAHSDHNVNIYRFAINKETKDIVYYDVIGDEFMTLEQWRKSEFYK